jgi:hypothetical protein
VIYLFIGGVRTILILTIATPLLMIDSLAMLCALGMTTIYTVTLLAMPAVVGPARPSSAASPSWCSQTMAPRW